jgi:hypothetical protein
MFNGIDPSIQNLKNYSSILDDSGYESMLLVYDPTREDYLIRIANIIDKSQKLKYLFAIRTYAISPEFLSMMCESFYKIDPDRIALNICAGDKQQMENEKHIDGLVDMGILKDDAYQRVLYTRKWIDKFVGLEVMSKMPYLVFSGTSDYTIETAKIYGDSTLCMYNSFNNDPAKFTPTPRTMVSLAVILGDSKEAALQVLDSFDNPNAKDWTLCGTEEDIRQEFYSLYNKGVTDILIANPFTNQDYNDKIHRVVKSMQDGK